MIELFKNTAHNIDCIELLNQLPSESINTIITDPPYMSVVTEEWDNQWKNIDEYIEWCDSWISESRRVLKKSGTFFIFGWAYQLAKLLPIFEKYGFSFKQDIVIWKGIQSAAGRTSSQLKMFPTTTEHLHFYYINSKDHIRDILQEKKISTGLSSREINEYLGKAINGGGTWSTIAGLKQTRRVEPTRDDWIKLDKLFGGLPNYDELVYKFNIEQGVTDVFDDINFYDKDYKKVKFHPTQKPLKLMDRIIKAASNEGDIILDLFSGSGVTAISCMNNNRNFIISELDVGYYEKSIQWIRATQADKNGSCAQSTSTSNEFFDF